MVDQSPSTAMRFQHKPKLKFFMGLEEESHGSTTQTASEALLGVLQLLPHHSPVTQQLFNQLP